MIAATSVFVAWAVTGLFLSLIPSFVTTTLKGNLALAGAVVALMLASATIVQLIAYRFESHRAQAVGLAVMIGGVIASYYVVVYIATAIPTVGVGALTVAIDSSTAIQVFGDAVIARCLAGLGGLLLERRGRQRFDSSAGPTSHSRA